MPDIYSVKLDLKLLNFGKASDKNYGNTSRSGKVLTVDPLNLY